MAKNRNLKKPATPRQGKHIKAPDIISRSTDNDPIIFSFHHQGNEKCIDDCEQHEKIAFADKLYYLSRHNWSQLKQVDHKKSGYEYIPRDTVRGNAPKSVTEDVDHFVVFRFNGDNARLIGYRDNAVYHILWIDRDLSMYKH